MADPWVITPSERAKHEEQFKSIGPISGYITGEQAKDFFLKSCLPPQILGVIWMLADLDGDGRMNITEFSIACKLINMKLRGANIPQILPPSIKQSACGAATQFSAFPADACGTSISAETASVVSSIATPPPCVSPLVPVQPPAPLIPMGTAQPPLAPVNGAVPVAPVSNFSPVPMSPPSQTAAVPRKVSMDSGSGTPVEGIPQPTRLRYTQVFNVSDRSKTGFISGVQARNILIQSQLPQPTLAQIWALSDIDNDGRLSCDEFIVAMYLCEQAKAGHKIPATLPTELIPVSLRRSRTSSIQSVGSVTTPVEAQNQSAAMILDTSFEDKRRENYEKGQAELDRRRKALLDAQRRETEERLRKEREEETKREKARQEAERRKQEELEREMQQQRELEAQREAERKRQEEIKEQAKKEAERLRQLEWEKQRLQELMNVRQKQQENLLALKAKNQSLGIDLATKEDKVKELTQKISTTRTGVTEVKATIDSMRTTRDTHMADMANLKAQAREQNQRLLNLNQEKAKLKARSLATAGASGAETAAVEASVTSKQTVIKQLKEKLDELSTELQTKETDVNNNSTEFDTLKEQLVMTADRCKDLYSEFTNKKGEVLALREKLVNPDAAWGDSGGSAWSGNETTWAEACQSTSSIVEPVQQAPCRPPPPSTGTVTQPISPDIFPDTNQADASSQEVIEYKAIYEFEARNDDELTFKPGDIILVAPSTGAEPGWLSGELYGKTGWFPVDYCQLVSGETNNEIISVVNEEAYVPQTNYGIALFNWKATQNNNLSLQKMDHINIKERWGEWAFGFIGDISGWFPLCYIGMVSDFTQSVTTPSEQPPLPIMPEELQHNDLSQYYLASFPYTSDEPGDLEFEAGEEVLVVKKEGDWWFGVIGQRRGIFPSNYVQLPPQQSTSEPVAPEQTEEESIPEPEEEVVQEQTKQSVGTPDSATLKVNQEDEAVNKEISELTKSPRSPKQTKGKKPDVAQVLAPYDATGPNQLSLVRGQLVMIRKKTSSGWWEGELQAKGKHKQIGWFPASYVKVLCGSSRTTPVSFEMTGRDEMPNEKTLEMLLKNAQNYKPVTPEPEKKNEGVGEKVEALYPYSAANPDELTFEPGDIICVLDKEDDAWWKGSLNGNDGVFPSNYVQPLTQGVTLQSPAEDSLCSDDDSFDSPEEYERQKIIHEIIETEKSYLKDLMVVQQAFIQPMRKSGLVTQTELDLIFVNWDDLVQVCSTFNKAINVRLKNSDGSVHMLSDILYQQLSLMTPYIRFCSLQMKGGALLEQKCSEGGMWLDIVKQCQESPVIGGHTLTSFLLKPIQRITKYPLLIKKLLLYTPVSHPDYYNTIEALNSAQTLCEQVNEAVKQKDNTDKLEWMQTHVKCDDLQERLIFNSLTNILGPRKVLLMGVLYKTKSKKELVVFLMSDFLLLTTPSKPIGHCSSLSAFERILSQIHCSMYRKPMFLNELQIQAVSDSEVAFSLSCPNSPEVVISANTSNERNNWLKTIALAKKHIEDTEKSLTNRRQSTKKKVQYIGRVLVEISHGSDLRMNSVFPRPPQGNLHVKLRANNLPASNQGPLNSFCEVSLGSQSQQTCVASTCNPKWISTMQFLVKSLQEDVLCITVYEKGYFRPNEFLGRTEIRVAKINEESTKMRGPIMTKLKLEEVNHGDITLKTSFHLFSNQH